MHAERSPHTDDSIRQYAISTLQESLNWCNDYLSTRADLEGTCAAVTDHIQAALRVLFSSDSAQKIGFHVDLIRIHGTDLKFKSSNELLLPLGELYKVIEDYYSPTQRLLRVLSPDQEENLRSLLEDVSVAQPGAVKLSRLLLAPYTVNPSILRLSTQQITDALSHRYFTQLFLAMCGHAEFSFQLASMIRVMPRLLQEQWAAEWLDSHLSVDMRVIAENPSYLCSESEFREQRALEEGNLCVITDTDGVPLMSYKFDGRRAATMLQSRRTNQGVVLNRGLRLTPEEHTERRIISLYVKRMSVICIKELPNSMWQPARDHDPINMDSRMVDIRSIDPEEVVTRSRVNTEAADRIKARSRRVEQGRYCSYI